MAIICFIFPIFWYFFHLAYIVDGPWGWKAGPNGPQELRRTWVWITSIIILIVVEVVIFPAGPRQFNPWWMK